MDDVSSDLVVEDMPKDSNLVDENSEDNIQGMNSDNVQYEMGDHNVQYEEDISENVQYGGELVVELMNDFSEQNAQEQESIAVRAARGEFESVNGDAGHVLLETEDGGQFAVASSQMAIHITDDGNILEGEVTEQVWKNQISYFVFNLSGS